MESHDSRSGNQQSWASTWQPLSRIQRRVVGVLVEKAKTVPDSYPMSLSGLVTGSNQKSNRSPQMSLRDDEVETALEQLRSLGAVIEVHGGGRVAKYKHVMYEWLGVDKVELAVMAELLLRGPQTLGDLRARASRMNPIADQAALQPVVQGLIEKGLMQALTPAGRGQVVTHCLYQPNEQAGLEAEYGGGGAVSGVGPQAGCESGEGAGLSVGEVSGTAGGAVDDDLRGELERLKERVAWLEEWVRSRGD